MDYKLFSLSLLLFEIVKGVAINSIDESSLQ